MAFSDLLEQEIDRHGLASVTDMIATIARGKAEHIAENWQDRLLAQVWNRAAGRFDRLTHAFTQDDATKAQR